MGNQELRQAGLKVTGPRVRILSILESHQDKHLSAEDVFQLLHEAGESLPLTTVYRVLTQFEQAGLVSRHNFEGGYSVFELDDGQHHDHMVCQETGKVIEFVSDDIEKLQHQIAAEHGYEIVDHRLVLYVKPQRS
jgi:Fur family ferric uptake transcriptional regulator